MMLSAWRSDYIITIPAIAIALTKMGLLSGIVDACLSEPFRNVPFLNRIEMSLYS